jgi:hypothetical protein
MSDKDLEAFKGLLNELLARLNGVSDEEWTFSINISLIEDSDLGVELESSGNVPVAADAPSHSAGVKIHSISHKCAMMGIFEPSTGSRTAGGYDAGAVRRFAALGG